MRIYSPPGLRKIDGGREAVILAWAQRSDRRWGVLLAWTGWGLDSSNRGTARARWGWCGYEQAQVRPLVPARSHNPEIEYAWYGQAEPNELGFAIWAAAGLLPANLRKAALTPSLRQGPQTVE